MEVEETYPFLIEPLETTPSEYDEKQVEQQHAGIVNLNERFGIVFFRENEKYLISKLDKHYEIKAFRHGIFILNQLTGQVYFRSKSQKQTYPLNNKKEFGMIYDENIHLLKFTNDDPIDKIITKYSKYFAMISKNGNAYLFNMEGSKNDGLIPKHLFDNEKIVQISCGGVHVLFLTENNKLFGTGSQYDGSLSKKTEDTFYTVNDTIKIVRCDISALGGKKIKQIATTYNCSFILTQDNELYSCGSGSYAANGQKETCLIFTKIKENVEKVIAGYFFVSIKMFSGEYFIFGYNNCNQFGDVDSSLMEGNKIYGTNTKLTTFNVHDIEQLECGGYHSIIVTKNNDIYYGGSSHNNALKLPKSTGYTKVEMSKVIKNWENIKRSTKIKVETGYDFTIIYNENKKNIFNFSNAYKISDMTFDFVNY
ncbi:hypothetical protein ABK040_012247 [Willaertia magna]